jgi:hypothetical protein
MPLPITPLFSFTMLTSKLSTIVGAPTFPLLSATKDRPKNRPECRPLHKRESGAPSLPCSEGQRGGLGEYRPTECSTPAAQEGVLEGQRQKARPPGLSEGRGT